MTREQAIDLVFEAFEAQVELHCGSPDPRDVLVALGVTENEILAALRRGV